MKQIEPKITSKKPTLFDGEDSDEEQNFKGNFEIKQQFEGEKGEKLRRLQDRFHGDSRFKMDSKFLEEDSDNENGESSHKNTNEVNNENAGDDIETNENDERQWQLNILESVIGKRVQKATPNELQKR